MIDAKKAPGSCGHLRILGFILFLMAWELLAISSEGSGGDIPSLRRMPVVLELELRTGNLQGALSASLVHLAAGTTAGWIAGVIAGYFLGISPRLAALAWPCVAVLRPIPALAWIPVAILVLGVTPLTAVAIVAQGVFWIVCLSTQGAVEGVEERYIELGRVYGATSGWHLARKITIPAALPGVAIGTRAALGNGWTMIVAAELCGVTGVGQRLWEAAAVLATDVVGFYMLIIGTLAALIDAVFRIVEERMVGWRRAA